jgi:predicted nuclease with TOPRIM domain
LDCLNVLTSCGDRDSTQDATNAILQELTEWRGKLDTRIHSYRSELTDMRQKLNSEVQMLREQFQDLQQSLKDQLAETSEIAGKEGEIAAQWAPKDV